MKKNSVSAPTIKQQTSSTRASTRSKTCVPNQTNLNAPINEFEIEKNREEKRNSCKTDNAVPSSKFRKINRETEKIATVKIDDLVWAKLSGWPYWPSMVILILFALLLVNFG